MGSISLLHGLKTLSGQQVGAIIVLTLFISGVSVITFFHCLIPSVSKIVSHTVSFFVVVVVILRRRMYLVPLNFFFYFLYLYLYHDPMYKLMSFISFGEVSVMISLMNSLFSLFSLPGTLIRHIRSSHSMLSVSLSLFHNFHLLVSVLHSGYFFQDINTLFSYVYSAVTHLLSFIVW